MSDQITDAIEGALWQGLADALNRLEDWGLLPLPDRTEIDAGSVMHGGGVREGGYLLRHGGAEDTPAHCWIVVARKAPGGES